ncbi:MAG: winged helix-turn-helix domain-containing protein [Pseudomonadota bacterium]
MSGLKETKDKVYGFQCGAEDYLSKPFAVEELRARVRARLRKKTTQKQVLLRIDSILFDFQFQKAQFVEGEESTDLALTPTEFKILYRIMNRKGNLCSRQDLVRDIWKKNGLFIEKSGVDSHISHLRKKLSPFPIKIHSIYNQGFLYS